MNSFSELSVLIPSYNGKAHLARCLQTLAELAPEAEVIVVDGSSSDGSAELVEREFPQAILKRCRNHGWAHASNRAAELSTREFLLFLNSDAFVTRDSLKAMCERLRYAPDVGAVAPMLINEDGSRQALFGVWYWPTWKPITRPTAAPVLSAACVMISRQCYERVGAFDENFFLYNEELDWCHRAKSLGYRLEILPVSVTHVGGGSTYKNPLLRLEAMRGFVYLSDKHWPSWITSVLRQSMQLEAWLGKRLDPRPAHRNMWAALESTMARRAYAESPFELSGRGVPRPTTPNEGPGSS